MNILLNTISVKLEAHTPLDFQAILFNWPNKKKKSMYDIGKRIWLKNQGLRDRKMESKKKKFGKGMWEGDAML